jgi:hypothetical protein
MVKPSPEQIEAAAAAAWSVFSPDDEWKSRHFYSQKCKTMDAVEAALTAVLKRPIAPVSLHWLGDRIAADETGHATDMRGCVAYFDRQSDCLEFMRWVERLDR